MKSGQKMLTWIIIILIAIGLLRSLLTSPQVLIMVLVFGTVFLLYKFPPNKWKLGRPKFYKNKKVNSKKAKFTVINGNKNDGEDEPPRYH